MSHYHTHESYRQAWAGAYTQDPPVPLNVDIELASVCNLSCCMCWWGSDEFDAEMRQKDFDGNPKKRFMPTEMAMRLIDECAAIGVPALKMNYRGESTLHKDYSKILQYARKKATTSATKGAIVEHGVAAFQAFHEILVNTNGVIKDHAFEGLMAATKVMVSLDSLDPDIYPKVRRGGNLNRAIDTIKKLKAAQHPNLWVRRVICKENAHESFVQKAKDLFGEDTHVSEHFTFDRNKEESVALHGQDFFGWERTYCTYPSVRLIVTASGVVLPCCVDWRATIPVGRWPNQSLLEIWNGEPIRKLRESLRKNDIANAPEMCKACSSFMAYKRPERAYVQDVEGEAKI